MVRRLQAFLSVGVLAAATAMGQAAPPTAADDSAKKDETVKREEVVVVSASKVESTLINAPATMSVITPEVLQNSPAQNYGDLLRNVPGVNVIQMSARDINLTSRQSTNTLSNSQLALLDGRSIYLDFFGLILWDLVPATTNEIKQIEVVRGPASAVWGANALTGVVYIITKSPRELAKDGTGSLTLGGGLLNRDVGSRADDGSGNAFSAQAFFAQSPNDQWSYKLSAAYIQSDAFSRPTGKVPVIADPRIPGAVCNTENGVGQCIGGASYPPDGDGIGAFENEGTEQPKFDARVDREFTDGGRLTFSGGYGGTTGIVHTGIGPFQLESGSYLGYGRTGYTRGALKISLFANFLDAKAPNLLLTDPATLAPVQLNFKTETFDFEVGHSTVLAGKHILSYGGNARRNQFEITLAPTAEDRSEYGVYLQDEIFFDKFRFTIGGRVDKFGNLEDPVFSPRLTAMYKPAPEHAFRVSFNQAFRAPSVINNYLDQDIFTPSTLNLSPLAPFAPSAVRPFFQAPYQPFFLRVKNVGNPDLTEESVTAYEIAYTGTFGKTTVGVAFYQNDQDNNINFTQLTPSVANPQGLPGFDVYTPANAPAYIGISTANRPVPSVIVPVLAAVPAQFGGPIRLPRTVTTYLNLGPTRQQGLELSVDHRVMDELSINANYSYQKNPEILEAEPGQIPYPTDELAQPAKHRFNAGINYTGKRWVATAALNYTSEALWTDVLSKEYHGFTDAYTMVNTTLGAKWMDGKFTTSLKAINLFNSDVQQHVFGDILKRQIYAELRLLF